VAPPAGARTVALGPDVHAAWSDASRGDLRPTGAGPADGGPLQRFAGELAASTHSRVDRVAWVTQVHGSRVRGVRWEPGWEPAAAAGGGEPSGPVPWHLGEGDALVSTTPGVALCVLTADCAPLALASAEGYFGAVHAGWRGLQAGVVEAAVARLRGRGATEVVGSLGPCIHAGCYAFGEDDLRSVADRYGDTVRGRTSAGGPALDLPAAVAAALGRSGVPLIEGVDGCTACGDGWFSHRARADAGRLALVVWSSRTGRA